MFILRSFAARVSLSLILANICGEDKDFSAVVCTDLLPADNVLLKKRGKIRSGLRFFFSRDHIHKIFGQADVMGGLHDLIELRCREFR